jgi:hypothetical protein
MGSPVTLPPAMADFLGLGPRPGHRPWGLLCMFARAPGSSSARSGPGIVSSLTVARQPTVSGTPGRVLRMATPRKVRAGVWSRTLIRRFRAGQIQILMRIGFPGPTPQTWYPPPGLSCFGRLPPATHRSHASRLRGILEPADLSGARVERGGSTRRWTAGGRSRRLATNVRLNLVEQAPAAAYYLR